MDLFTVAGLQQPDISILSEEFLAEVRALPQKNVAVELLRRLIEDEIRSRRRRNLIQSRSFSAMLQDALARYNQQSIAAAGNHRGTHQAGRGDAGGAANGARTWV